MQIITILKGLCWLLLFKELKDFYTTGGDNRLKKTVIKNGFLQQKKLPITTYYLMA